MTRPRVLLADDHRQVADALKNLLSVDFEVVRVVEDGLSLIQAAAELEPDVIVADISMPRIHGLNALAHLKKKNPAIKVVFVTMYQDAALVSLALSAGALGFVLKHSATDQLVPAVRAALEGKTFVPTRLAAGHRPGAE